MFRITSQRKPKMVAVRSLSKPARRSRCERQHTPSLRSLPSCRESGPTVSEPLEAREEIVELIELRLVRSAAGLDGGGLQRAARGGR